MYTFTLAYTYTLSQTLLNHRFTHTHSITHLLSLTDTNSPIHKHTPKTRKRHSYTHTCTHILENRCSLKIQHSPCSHSYTKMYTQSQSYTRKHILIQPSYDSQSYKYTYSHMHTYSYSHKCSDTPTHSKNICLDIHTFIYWQTHTCFCWQRLPRLEITTQKLY